MVLKSFFVNFFWAVYPISPNLLITVFFPIFLETFLGKALWRVRLSMPCPGGRSFKNLCLIILSSLLLVALCPNFLPRCSFGSWKVATISLKDPSEGLVPSSFFTAYVIRSPHTRTTQVNHHTFKLTLHGQGQLKQIRILFEYLCMAPSCNPLVDCALQTRGHEWQSSCEQLSSSWRWPCNAKAMPRENKSQSGRDFSPSFMGGRVGTALNIKTKGG